MTISLRSVRLAAAAVLCATAAGAQTPAPAQAAPASETAFRYATPTADGDTGLWYVPTAEVLARGKWSVSGYRVGLNYPEGFTNVADVPVTFAVGLTNRVELFGSFAVISRVDRDLRPLFISDPDVGGPVSRYPFVRQGWSGNQVGDLQVGGKFNVLSEADRKPVALALRAALRLPTGDKEKGVSTGKTSGFFDLVASKEAAQKVELAGYVGAIMRANADGASQSNGIRYGFGAGFPSRSPLRATAEFNGERPFDDTITLSAPLLGVDGSLSPTRSTVRNFNAATLGLTYQTRRGIFFGAGATWSGPRRDRDLYRTDEDEFGDFVDYQFRIGYHPGARRYVAPPPPPPPPPPPAPPANRPPTVQARCEPCTVEVGKTSTITAVAQDPDGDTLTYRWSAGGGTAQNPSDRQTLWTAPMTEGPVQATVTVDDGKGGTAQASTTIQVVRPAPVVELTFEDVYFDFDRSTLRPDALRLLDDAVAKLQAEPTKNLIIEGHTCNIGTAEYNLALGERRAKSVLDYLASRGVPASRLETRSYGEERPKHDNAREETRRLNRRAALVVKVQ